MWHARVDDESVVRLWGEVIGAALMRGTELGDIVLRVANVTSEIQDGSEPRAGDYVAMSITGKGDWRPELVWAPLDAPQNPLVSWDLDGAARRVGAKHASNAGTGT